MWKLYPCAVFRSILVKVFLRVCPEDRGVDRGVSGSECFALLLTCQPAVGVSIGETVVVSDALVRGHNFFPTLRPASYIFVHAPELWLASPRQWCHLPPLVLIPPQGGANSGMESFIHTSRGPSAPFRLWWWSLAQKNHTLQIPLNWK